MFQLNAAQIRSAERAMHGILPSHFLHVFLLGISLVALLWFLCIVLGLYHSVQTHHMDVGDALGALAMATLVFIITGTLLHYP